MSSSHERRVEDRGPLERRDRRAFTGGTGEHPRPSGLRPSVGLAALGLAGVALTATTIVLVRRNYLLRFPANRAWVTADWLYFVAAWVSVALGQLVGLWLWWRAPRNPTGRWLWLAGVALGVWLVGLYWPDRWGMQLALVISVMRPALAMAVLGWPSGRPSSTVRRWVLTVALAGFVLTLGIGLFGRALSPAGWPSNPLAPFDIGWVDPVLTTIYAWVLLFAPALAVVIALVRKRASLPPDARRLVTPVTVVGVAIAASDLLTVVLTTMGADLLFDSLRGRSTVLGTALLVQNYGQVALASVGLLVATAQRRRVTGAGTRRLELDLEGAVELEPASAALQRALGDPSARLPHPTTGGRFLDSAGRPAVLDDDDRVLTPLYERGELVMGIDTDATVAVHPQLLSVAAASVASRLTNERATALAAARRAELVALQHALLDRTDTARRRLERDLHDGAQQRLVGLTLAARLAARTPSSASVDELRRELDGARREVVALVAQATPSVLDDGLAAALATLAATTAVRTSLLIDGDLGGRDPLAATIWFVAAEALTNVVKHAGASKATIELVVTERQVVLRVTDDGRGGVTVPPRSIATRLAELDGTVSAGLGRPTGTVVEIELARDPEGAMA